MQLLSDRIGLAPSPSKLDLAPGDHCDVSVAVTNTGQVVDRFQLSVDGVDPGWVVLRQSATSLFPGESATLSFTVQVPLSPEPVATVYAADVRVASDADPTSVSSIELPIQVLAVGEVRVKLSPKLVRTRYKAHFLVSLHNDTNADHVIDLRVEDDEQALLTHLDADRVRLSARQTRDLDLEVLPRERPWIAPPRRYGFSMLARPFEPPEAESVAPTPDAQAALIYNAPLAFLAPIPAVVRSLLLAALALAAALALLAWLLGAAGVQIPFLPTPTPVPTVTPTPTPAPTETATPAPAAGATGAGSGAGAAAAVKPTSGPPPNIETYALNVPDDASPGEFELNWKVDGADSVTIAGQPEPTQGSLRLRQPDGGEFVLQATNSNGVVRKSIGVIVLQPPNIDQFAADPTEVPVGGTTTLSWTVQRADRAVIDATPVSVDQGTLEVHPEANATYTLVAENGLGRVEQSVSVNMAPTPTP